ncbi:MAG: non-canonical purine NTP pyrophosphatase, RdgB/HAM1 family [Hyphomicrobium sp. 32-62-53]|nr:MAG: non-canonical purine NTP pyrophosphatase, RdgB/HAM1 family [Hyphomicrobium sp. 12-62-95]OYY01063.1 MAG: non-canonical purine NTP pyrophosphatase, RdgB/HAM1 family [Hyphomicrobium sp. 32-62-53]
MRTLTRGTKLVVASHNKGKVWEINQLIAPYGLEAISAGTLGLEEPEETEPTFEGNAKLKALAAAKGAALPALADDSGLEVECLGGAPGIFSARWAGPQKDFGLAMEKVAKEITSRHGWAAPGPRANFISVLCLAWPDGETATFEGKVFGRLVWPPRGGNGFGYDPMFVPDGHDLTFGEMEPAGKYAISHRTRAFDAFRKAALGDLSAEPVKPNAERDTAGLHAAAANISTRDELKTFVKYLSADLERRGQPRVNLGTLMVALEDSVGEKSDEPRWRTLAKALLAATEAKQP